MRLIEVCEGRLVLWFIESKRKSLTKTEWGRKVICFLVSRDCFVLIILFLSYPKFLTSLAAL